MFKAVDALDEALMYAGPAFGHACFTHIQQERAPQLGLPAVGWVERFGLASTIAQLVPACGPIFQPVGTVDLVLVEQVSQALGELVAFAQVGVLRQEALQRLEVRLVDQLG